MKFYYSLPPLLVLAKFCLSARGFAPSTSLCKSRTLSTKLGASETIVIGGGRIGSLISDGAKLLGRNDPIATSIDADGEGPIYIATRNDVLESIVNECPESRLKDLVFVQNGYLDDFLKRKNLLSNTQALLYLSVPSKGVDPVDGITAMNPEGLTAATGVHAQAFADRLAALGLKCNVVSAEDYRPAMFEKLIWISTYMLVGTAKDCKSVGQAGSEHTQLVQDVISELVSAVSAKEGIAFPEGTIERLAAYTDVVTDFPCGVKEFEWRNKYFYDLVEACPIHNGLLKECAEIQMPFPKLIVRPKAARPTDNDDSVICKPICKPVLEIGSEVCAGWLTKSKNKKPKFYDGVVKSFKMVDKDFGYGPVVLYDVLFDDDTISYGIESVFVYLKEDFRRLDKNWKGVTNVYDKGSKDRWAKEVGWFKISVNGTEKTFPRLSEAIRAYDQDVVRRKGPNTLASDLNLPEEWKWLPMIKSNQCEAVASDDAQIRTFHSDNRVHGVHAIKYGLSSPFTRTEKERKETLAPFNKVDANDNSMVCTQNTKGRSKSASPVAETAKTQKISGNVCIDLTGPSPTHDDAHKTTKTSSNNAQYKSKYKGVSFNKKDKRYQVFVNSKYAGSHHLAADAAYAYDKISGKANGPGSRLHFTTVEHYYDAREEEIKDLGLDLDTVGTVEDVYRKILRYLDKPVSKDGRVSRKRMRSGPLRNRNV
eukprot:CCRYP_015623-RC/>CCRYP_015623-RC protein AED:0.07 eAED:0.07 QI:213/0.8/0.66/1/0.8/0.66/6/1170/706